MIDKKRIEELVKGKLENGMFLVDVTVSTDNVIHVFIDSNEGITINDCVAISRNIEQNLDREMEDFELQVSSAGLGQPYKVFEQYLKNIGNEVEVISKEGDKLKGVLTDANQEGIVLETSKKVMLEGHKKKQVVTESLKIKFDRIKSTKTIISFK